MAIRFDKSELAMESPRVWAWENRLKLLLIVALAYAFLLSLLAPALTELRDVPVGVRVDVQLRDRCREADLTLDENDWTERGETGSRHVRAARLLRGDVRADFQQNVRGMAEHPRGERPAAELLARLFQREGIDCQILESEPGLPQGWTSARRVPPEGPPRGTNFSRRNAMQPLPPSPALIRILASSMNKCQFSELLSPRMTLMNTDEPI